MKSGRGQLIIRVLAFVFVIGITVLLFVFRNRISNIQAYGYPVVFVLAILTNATLIVPLPGVAMASLLGANPMFNPFWVAVVIGFGSALGELTGYLAGFGGQAIIGKGEWYCRIEGWMKSYGPATVFVLALVPNPLFDMAGIAAGALHMPVLKFLFWCSLGKIAKMLLFAYGGAGIIRLFPWFTQWE